MANNEYRNKVVLADGTVLMDLTGDDVRAQDVLAGKKFHLPSGAPGTGTCTYDADTSDATATADEVLDGKTSYKNGQKIIGTMPNRGGAGRRDHRRGHARGHPAGMPRRERLCGH